MDLDSQEFTMMCPFLRRLLPTIAVFAALALSSALAFAEERELEFAEQWTGEAPTIAFNDVPWYNRTGSIGYINDTKTFAAVWKEIYGSERVPAVDFKKQIVLFIRNTHAVKNIHKASATLDNAGVVTLNWNETSSFKGGETRLRCVLAVVDAGGIKKIKAGSVTIEVKPAGDAPILREPVVHSAKPVPPEANIEPESSTDVQELAKLQQRLQKIDKSIAKIELESKRYRRVVTESVELHGPNAATQGVFHNYNRKPLTKAEENRARALDSELERLQAFREHTVKKIAEVRQRATDSGALMTVEDAEQVFLSGLKYYGEVQNPERKSKAFQCFLASSRAGHIESQFAAGQMLINGDGVAKDVPAGLKLLTSATEAGHIRAALFMAQHTWKEHPKDAIQLFERAANLGSFEASEHLSVVYRTGQILAADKDKALYWSRRAVGQRILLAYFELQEVTLAAAKTGEKDELRGYRELVAGIPRIAKPLIDYCEANPVSRDEFQVKTLLFNVKFLIPTVDGIEGMELRRREAMAAGQPDLANRWETQLNQNIQEYITHLSAIDVELAKLQKKWGLPFENVGIR